MMSVGMLRAKRWILFVALPAGAALAGGPALAKGPDEPGLQMAADEPGIRVRAPEAPSPHRFYLEAGFGLSSLVVDPDVELGFGGGFYLGYAYGRFGGEISAYVGRNSYADTVGEVGSAFVDAFIAGNISAGPTFLITRPDSRVRLSLDFGLGTYAIANPIQQLVWTFGLHMGASLAYRFTSWLGVGLKLRYHLFNLARFGGGELLDRVTLSELGVLDRLEFPVFVGFYF